MVQGREDLRFTLEPGEPVRIEREMLREDLEGDVPAQCDIPGSPHLSHPAGPDGRVDLIRAEANAGLERHLLRWPEL